MASTAEVLEIARQIFEAEETLKDLRSRLELLLASEGNEEQQESLPPISRSPRPDSNMGRVWRYLSARPGTPMKISAVASALALDEKDAQRALYNLAKNKYIAKPQRGYYKSLPHVTSTLPGIKLPEED